MGIEVIKINEIWKPVEGFEGWYEVSNTGKVRSLDRKIKLRGKREGQYRIYTGRELRPLNSQGHLTVHLQKQGKRCSIGLGLLVANHFLDGFKESDRKHVRYKDGNCMNCCVENLE